MVANEIMAEWLTTDTVIDFDGWTDVVLLISQPTSIYSVSYINSKLLSLEHGLVMLRG